MLFITNRFPTHTIKTRIGRAFDFDLKNNAASNSVFYCRRLGNGKYEEIGGFNLMSELKASPYRQLLIYIHGFSNRPEAVFEGAAESQALCDKQKKNEVLVLPVVWPCDDDLGIVKDGGFKSEVQHLTRSKVLPWKNDVRIRSCGPRIGSSLPA